MKSSTTFLHNLLINHPEIKMIQRNMDYAYFDDDRIYVRGKDWYLSLFDEVKKFEKTHKIGQTSADCAFNPGSIDRIVEHNPDIKLIFVLRHPIDRAYSLYWHQYGMGREFRRFEEAIKKEPSLIKKSYHHFKHYSYVERSRYKMQFENIFSKINNKQVLLIDFEELTKNTKNTINSVFKFLDISKIEDLEDLKYSQLSRNPALIPKYHIVVQITSFIQKIGFVGIGRRIGNWFREEKRPPKMKEATRKILEIELQEDIKYYNQLFDK